MPVLLGEGACAGEAALEAKAYFRSMPSTSLASGEYDLQIKGICCHGSSKKDGGKAPVPLHI